MTIAFLDISLIDIIDVLLVGLLLYRLYKLTKGSTTVRVFTGFFLFALTYLIVRLLGLRILTAILGKFIDISVLAVVVLFQQEIRRLFAWAGNTMLFRRRELIRLLLGHRQPHTVSEIITPIVETAKVLAGNNTGALIVLSKEDALKFYKESGDLIDAVVSKRLLIAIFNRKSPLHDGGVIIYHNRVVAARCILPVTERRNLPPQLGLRHRAAIGVSEVTDTLILVVSEETGQIAVARQGVLSSNLSVQETRAMLNDYLQSKHKP